MSSAYPALATRMADRARSRALLAHSERSQIRPRGAAACHDGQVAPAWEEQHSSLTTAMRQLLLRICRQILCECTPREEEDRVIRSSREHARATVSQVMSGITG